MAAEKIPPERLASWMRDEYRTLRSMMTVIKEHIATVPESEMDTWLDGLREAQDRLHTHLARVFEAQEQGGYMEHLLVVRPTLSREIDGLKREHAQLLNLSHNIRDALAGIDPADHLLAADASARLQRFMAVVNQHEQRENMITQLVLNEEHGSGD
jgi:hemerythrin-like domain-containing protein